MEKSVSSRYQQNKNENRALTPRSGLDSGMSFSFSSFGDENFGLLPINQQPFKPIRIPFNTSRMRPEPITPSFFHEHGKDLGDVGEDEDKIRYRKTFYI